MEPAIFQLPYGSKRLVLTEPYVFYMENKKMIIPKGFRWNGANIPPVFKPVVGGRFCQQNILPSLIHDYLIDINWDIDDRDLRFYQVLLETGRSRKVAYIMYKLVKLYSLVFFKQKKVYPRRDYVQYPS